MILYFQQPAINSHRPVSFLPVPAARSFSPPSGHYAAIPKQPAALHTPHFTGQNFLISAAVQPTSGHYSAIPSHLPAVTYTSAASSPELQLPCLLPHPSVSIPS
ncbi:hypothetical protein AAC387_Pa05g0880 [Persea americana]